ncbi:SDR family oxidoreductase [Membranicola marinus]|uniref:SDR family oxidoreductase n=2 Tax=Membranihabitans marinus TaxID=1227546 RepID=A0A953HWV2_9BACT|nr:SDR family oxidoreductase [Membranihabitans marinus]MBY5959253.1 SDR family oxidoreductase [Membranihabitans marinus]
MEFNQKTIVITGGGSGIGWAISQAFARQGGQVFMLEIDKDTAQKKVEEMGFSDRITTLQCDVSNQDNVQECVAQIIRSSERIDVLVNNAGVAHIGTAVSTSEADLDRIYQVNIKGVYNCLHSVLPHMVKQQNGAIVNMASIAASLGIPDRFAYSASKGAVLAMTYQVAKDFIDDGIRCNSVSPARVHTPFVDGYIKNNYPGREQEMFENLSKTQPIGRMGEPEEIADLVLFLCSDKAGFMTGTDYPIDGGFIRL